MQLVIAALSRASDVRIVQRLFRSTGRVPDHVRAVLVTPLVVSSDTLAHTRRLKEEFGARVLFDSGGYAVQTGRLDYYAMYSGLIDLYRRERWADLYTLPDNVPKGLDSDTEVEAKVRQTVECSELFFEEMPDELRDRALGVVHGRSRAQMEFCLDHYLRLGLHHVGFGSFGTAGQNSSMNIATAGAIANARTLVQLAGQQSVTVHLFGIGAPAILPWIAGTGATSFDSAAWARGAGFGQVFLPLTRGYNISHRLKDSTIQQGLTRADFERLRAASGHSCDYCTSFERLQENREARAAHNILATVDALDIVVRRDTDRMEAIYSIASPKYRTVWKDWIDAS